MGEGTWQSLWWIWTSCDEASWMVHLGRFEGQQPWLIVVCCCCCCCCCCCTRSLWDSSIAAVVGSVSMRMIIVVIVVTAATGMVSVHGRSWCIIKAGEWCWWSCRCFITIIIIIIVVFRYIRGVTISQHIIARFGLMFIHNRHRNRSTTTKFFLLGLVLPLVLPHGLFWDPAKTRLFGTKKCCHLCCCNSGEQLDQPRSQATCHCFAWSSPFSFLCCHCHSWLLCVGVLCVFACLVCPTGTWGWPSPTTVAESHQGVITSCTHKHPSLLLHVVRYVSPLGRKQSSHVKKSEFLPPNARRCFPRKGRIVIGNP